VELAHDQDPVAGFGISGVEDSGSVVAALVQSVIITVLSYHFYTGVSCTCIRIYVKNSVLIHLHGKSLL
jgi:hypothetical protein